MMLCSKEKPWLFQKDKFECITESKTKYYFCLYHLMNCKRQGLDTKVCALKPQFLLCAYLFWQGGDLQMQIEAMETKQTMLRQETSSTKNSLHYLF